MILRDVLVCATFAVAAVASTPAAAAARSAEELNALASLRYQAAQTEAVAGRLGDAKIVALRKQVYQSEAALRATREKLKAAQATARQDKAAIAEIGRKIDSLLNTLAADKTAFTDELAKRDADYARDLTALQLAGEQLLATPEGLRALKLYNAGGPGAFEAADTVLGRVEAARAQAREEASLVQKAEDRRARARLALDARGRGLTSTAIVIERWEAVVDVGRPIVRDWTNLVDLYLEAGQLTRARDAAAKGVSLARNDEERAVALWRAASTLNDAGDLIGALETRREVLALDRKAAANEPGSPERLRQVSLALRDIGYLQSATGDIAGARASTEEAWRIDEQRLVLAPTLEVRREISIDIGALADIDSARSDHPAALARRIDVLARAREILAVDPELLMSQRNLAISLLDLAWAEMEYGRYADAQTLLPEAMAIADTLIAKDPASSTYLDDKIAVLAAYATTLKAALKYQAARECYTETLSLARRIVEIDPASATAQWRLSQALVDASFNFPLETDFEANLALLEEALATVRPLLAANPSPRSQQDAADILTEVALRNELVQRYEVALSAYREALALLLLAEKSSQALSVQNSLAGVYGSLGNLAVKMGDKSAALKHTEAAVAIRRKIVAINPERGGQVGLSDTLSRLGTAYQANGQFEKALAARREEIAIWRGLLEGSQSPDADKGALAKALLTAAYTASLANDVPFAQAAYREGLNLLRETDAKDPDSNRGQLLYSLSNYAKAPGTPPDIKFSLLEERVGLLRGLNRQSELATAIFDLALARRDAGNASGALRDYAEGRKILGALIAAEPDRSRDRRTLAQAALEVSRMTCTENDWRQALAAIAAWRAADADFDGGEAMLQEVRSHLPADAPAANQQSEGAEP